MSASRARRTGGENVGVVEVLAWLKRASTRHDLDNLARFGITATRPFGVSMAKLRVLAKRLGRRHELAERLWMTGRHEARMLAALIDEPKRVTKAQMDRWCRDFDNWGLCDTVCFHLFDRTPLAWGRIRPWAAKRDEFVRRAAFALLASLALHDKTSDDRRFRDLLPLVERSATDERNFVKKGVSWALRGIGHRSAALRKAAMAVATRLSESTDSTARWVGRDALRDLRRPSRRGRA